MEETADAVANAQPDLLEEIDACLRLIDVLQERWMPDLEHGDLKSASGRRCVLQITDYDGKVHSRLFEVTEFGIKVLPPEGHYNTLILAPIDAVAQVLKGVLAGDRAAFSSEWAKGRARIVGDRKLHDGFVFSEIFGRLADRIKAYRESGT